METNELGFERGLLVGLLLFSITVMGCAPEIAVTGSEVPNVEVRLPVYADVSISGENVPVGVQPGMEAPNFAATDMNGRTFQLTDLVGRAVMLNFWVSSSDSCEVEMSRVDTLSRAYREYITVVGVNSSETEEMVRNFVNARRYEWRFVLDANGTVRDLYAVANLPTSVFINKHGIITARGHRALSLDELDRLSRQAIGVNY